MFFAGYPRTALALLLAGTGMSLMLVVDAEPGERAMLVLLGIPDFALPVAGVLMTVFGPWLGAQRQPLS